MSIPGTLLLILLILILVESREPLLVRFMDISNLVRGHGIDNRVIFSAIVQLSSVTGRAELTVTTWLDREVLRPILRYLQLAIAS